MSFDLLLTTHILVMLSILPLALLLLGSSLWYLQRGSRFPLVVAAAFTMALVLFVGGLPLGWAVAYREFGVAWTGVPLGWDFTDNKTLVLLLYWSGVLFLARGRVGACVLASLHEALCFLRLRGLTRFVPAAPRTRLGNRHRVSNKVLARLSMYGSFVSLAAFAVPHSIRLPAWVSVTAFAVVGAPFVLVSGLRWRRAVGGRRGAPSVIG